MAEDLGVGPARLGLSVGAVLAHADAVTPAAAGDEEHRLTVGGRRRLLPCRRNGSDGENADDESERVRARTGPG